MKEAMIDVDISADVLNKIGGAMRDVDIVQI